MQSKRMKALAVAALTALMGTSAYGTGATLTWDWDGEAPFGGPQDGFWFVDGSFAQWSADGGASYVAWDNSGDHAIFGSAGGTVTVDPSMTNVASLKFDDNYTLTGSDINLGSGAAEAVINVKDNKTATINNTINLGTSSLRVGNAATYGGTLILGGAVTGSATTIIAERMTVKLGVNDALPTNQTLNMPAGSAIATLDLNGFNQTISAWTGAGQNIITNTSATPSTLTLNTIWPAGTVPFLQGNLNITLAGAGGTRNWVQPNTFTGTLWLKPNTATSILTTETGVFGANSAKVKLDATNMPGGGGPVTLNFSTLDNTQKQTYVQGIELVHADTGIGTTDRFARILMAGPKNITLAGVISGGTAGGLGLVLGGANGSAQGNLILAGNNTYQGTTRIVQSTHMVTLANNGALGNSAGATATDPGVIFGSTANTLAFMGNITLANSTPITISSSGGTIPTSGYGNIHNLSGNNVANNDIQWSSGTTKFFGAEAGSTLTLNGILGLAPPSEPAGITKVGYGTIVLTNANLFGTRNAGGTSPVNQTVINEGTLRLDFSPAGGPTDNIINPTSTGFSITGGQTSALNLGGGTLEVKGAATETNTQRFRNAATAGFTINAGASAIRVDQNGAANVSITTGQISAHSVGGTVDFTLPEIVDATTRKGTVTIVNGTLPTGNVGEIISANGAAFMTVDGTEWAGRITGNVVEAGSRVSPTFYTQNTATTLGGNADMSHATDTTVTLAGSDPVLTSLRFNNSGARTINATGQTLTTGGILITSNVGANTSTISGGTLRGNTGAANQDLVIIQNNTVGKLLVSSTIADNGSPTALTKSGAGMLELSAANTYNGATTINGGVLKLSNATAIPGGIDSTGGLGNINFKGGVIGLTAASGDFKRGIGTGATQVQFNGSGGFAAYGGNRNVNLGGAAATVTFGSSPAAGTFVLTGNQLIFGAPDADSTVIFQNPISLRSPNAPQQREIFVHDGINAATDSDARLTGASPVTDGGLTKTGTGILELAAVNGYVGETMIEAGTLRSGINSAISSDSVLTVRAGKLELGAFNNTFNRIGVTMGGGGAGTTSAITSTTGTFTLGTGLTYAGTIDSGASISGLMSLGGSVRSFVISDSSNAANDVDITANLAATAGGITKSGAGTLRLAGSNGYTGTTTVSAGTLRLANGSAIADTGAVVVNAGTLDVTGSETVGSLAGTGGSVTIGSGVTLTAGSNNTTTTYAGVISGATGSLGKSGTGTMKVTGVNTYGGGTSVTGGLLAIGADSGLGASGTGVSLNGGGLRFDATSNLGSRAFTLGTSGGVLDTNGNNATIGGAVTGVSGSLTKNGAGTVTLSNTGNTYGGGTTLNDGTVEFAGNLGSGGTINFNGGGIKFASGNNTDISAGRTLAMNSTNTTTNSIDVPTGGNVTFANDVGNFGSGHLIKAGPGTLTINGQVTHLGETRAHEGTLVLGQSSFFPKITRAAGGTIVLAQSTDPDRVIKTGNALGDGMKTSALGKIDLKNNKGIIPKATTNTTTIGNFNDTLGAMYYTGVYGMVQRGRHGGTWDGLGVNADGSGGIMTSMPDALAGITGIGVAPAAFAGEEFAGQILDEQGDVKLMYTYVGDADLDGSIDGDDFATIDASYPTHADGNPNNNIYGYANGDFDYNGTIDADDYWYIDRNYVKQTGLAGLGKLPAAPIANGVTAVPEPGSVALIGMAALGALRRRRRKD